MKFESVRRGSTAKIGERVVYWDGESIISEVIGGNYVRLENGQKLDFEEYIWVDDHWEKEVD